MLKFVIYSALLLITNVVGKRWMYLSEEFDVLGEPDYHFNAEVDGWLKLHKFPETWHDAVTSCFYEGAVLASPINPKLAAALGALMRPPKDEAIQSIYVGANALLSRGNYISIEGIVLTDFVKSNSSGKPDSCVRFTADNKMYTTSCEEYLPYVCYTKRDINTVKNKCGTFDDGYKFISNTEKCYKLHEERKMWNESHKICTAEGGHLVIINDKKEADAVTALMPKMQSDHEWDPAHVGLKYWSEQITWLTVHGEKPENVYNVWGQESHEGDDLCGCILQNGNLNTHWCNAKSKFICEKDPETTRFDKAPQTENQ